jgi:hypothetical protein
MATEAPRAWTCWASSCGDGVAIAAPAHAERTIGRAGWRARAAHAGFLRRVQGPGFVRGADHVPILHDLSRHGMFLGAPL